MIIFVLMKFHLKFGIFATLWVLLFAGCQNQTVLRSSSSIKKDLQGTWNMVSIAENQIEERWKFEDGSLYRYERDANKEFAIADTGYYEVNTSLTEPYLTTTDLTTFFCYNAKWQIIQMDNDVLIILHDQPCNGGGKGLLQREFSRAK